MGTVVGATVGTVACAATVVGGVEVGATDGDGLVGGAVLGALVDEDDGIVAAGSSVATSLASAGGAVSCGAAVVATTARAGRSAVAVGWTSTPTSSPPSTASPMTRSAASRRAATRPIIGVRSLRGDGRAGDRVRACCEVFVLP